MPSITTQNIAAASAQTVQTNTQAAAQSARIQQAATHAEATKVTQNAAAQATQGARRRDQERTAQIPKRTENAFRPQEDKPDQPSRDSVAPRRRRDDGSLDVEA